MKKIWLFVLLLTTTIQSASLAQAGDPFNWTAPIKVEANDVFLLWGDKAGGMYKSYQKVYKYKIDSTTLPVNSRISKSPRHVDNRTQPSSPAYMDIATGKFTVGPYENVVAIWKGQSGIQILIPQFDSTEAMWTDTVQATLGGIWQDRAYVRTGDFDGDGLDEFVVAAVGDVAETEGRIYFYVFDVDSLLRPTLVTTYHAETLADVFSYQYNNYFIDAGDLNGDGRDEIILQAINGSIGNSVWSIYVKIYEVEQDTIISKIKKTIQQPEIPYVEGINIAVSCGQFKNDQKDEIAFVSVLREGFSPIGPFENIAYIYLLESSSDLQEIFFDESKRKIRPLPTPSSLYNQLSLSSGDLNNDGRDEVVFSSGVGNYVYATDDSLNLYAKATINAAEGGGFDFLQSYNYLKVADVNLDDHEDIVVVKNFVSTELPDGFFVAMISANDDLTQLNVIGRFFGDEPPVLHV